MPKQFIGLMLATSSNCYHFNSLRKQPLW